MDPIEMAWVWAGCLMVVLRYACGGLAAAEWQACWPDLVIFGLKGMQCSEPGWRWTVCDSKPRAGASLQSV